VLNIHTGRAARADAQYTWRKAQEKARIVEKEQREYEEALARGQYCEQLRRKGMEFAITCMGFSDGMVEVEDDLRAAEKKERERLATEQDAREAASRSPIISVVTGLPSGPHAHLHMPKQPLTPSKPPFTPLSSSHRPRGSVRKKYQLPQLTPGQFIEDDEMDMGMLQKRHCLMIIALY